jgi:hypothetical protein
MVARAVGWSRGEREADGAGVEPRSTGNQDPSSGAIGRSPVSARQEARRRASLPTNATSSCGQDRHPAPGQIPAGSNCDGPRSLR